MSGIAGMVCAPGTIPNRVLLDGMTAFLKFRGPDGSFTLSQQSVGFCHTVLAPDLASRQCSNPFVNNGSAWINADVRLNARNELLESLQARGAAIANPASDTELIFRAWEVWGEDCLERLHGDFAFALWDSSARRLWCVRDRFGVKPFFYAHIAGSMIFSNTLDCVRMHPAVSDGLDERFIGDFLLTGWNPNPAITAFRDIARLPAAHALRFEHGSLTVARYWSLPTEEIIRHKQPQDYLREFLTLLEQAVADRLPSDSAGLLLSGGLDSTSIAAMAKHVCKRRQSSCDFRAYTFDYRPLLRDEEPEYAVPIARWLGIPLQLVSATPYLPYARWDDAELNQPEPVHDPFLALAHDHLHQAAQHSRVLLGGEGGDALLLGETWPYLTKLCKNFKFSTVVREFGGYLAAHRRLPPLLSGYPSRVRNWLTHESEFLRYPSWINKELESHLDLRARWKDLQLPNKQTAAIRPRAFANIASPFWTSLWEGSDPGVTGSLIETRMPLFDLRVVRFLLRVPPLPWCANKELMRRAMRGILPQMVLERPKAPLAADPLIELVHQKKWNPLPLPQLSPELERFVAPKRLQLALETNLLGGMLWTNLRAYGLNYWLQRTSRSSIKLGREKREKLDEAAGPCSDEKALRDSATSGLRQFD